MAKLPKRYWGSCQRLWRMLKFKGGQAYALWWLSVLACIDSSMERPLDGFCHWIIDFNQLERWQLWLHPSHCWPTYKNSALWANQGHYQWPRIGKNNYRRSGATSRPPELHYQWPRSDFYIQVLVLALLLPQYQETTLHRVPPLSRRADGTTKQYDGGIPSSFRQLQTKWLGKTLADDRVCV